MNTKRILGTLLTLGLFAAGTPILLGQDIQLPPPDKKGGKPLMECFTLRKSTRQFSPKPLPAQVLSNLFYAADGISRPDGRKTVPTARNAQNQSIYVAMEKGLYVYNPKTNSLKQLSRKDIRAVCGKQPFHKIAPAVLIYVGDLAKVGKNREEQILYAANHAGYTSQNVYLYAASEGLSTVVCAMVDRDALAKAMNLPAGQEIMFTQPVAYPAE